MTRRVQHSYPFSGRNQVGRPDQWQDHGPNTVLGVLVDARGQQDREPPATGAKKAAPARVKAKPRAH